MTTSSVDSSRVFVITTEYDYEGNQVEFMSLDEKTAREKYIEMVAKIYEGQKDNKYVSRATSLKIASYPLEKEYTFETHIFEMGYRDIVINKGIAT